MLEEIFISGEASYSTTGERLYGLKPINFVFETNGSGKTTISRIIARPSDYPTSRIKWQGGRRLECIVYNSDFLAKNYSSQMPGIFTLGEHSSETLTKIEESKAKIDEILGKITNLEGVLGSDAENTGKRGDLRSLRQSIEEQCWALKLTHDIHFQEAFAGLRNSKEKFCDRALSEFAKADVDFLDIEELKTRASTVFEKGIVRQQSIMPIDFGELLELEHKPILAKKVVGKDDIDLAALIKRLGNSDWVRQGLNYVSESGGQCPFCQQEVDDDIYKRLSNYFDETFLNDIASIERTCDAYQRYTAQALERLEALFSVEQRYLNTTELRAAVDRLSARIELNKQQLDRKRKEPSVPVALESLSHISTAIAAIISTANASIDKHNAVVDNLSAERATLISQIWRYLVHESHAVLTKYTSDKSNLEKAVAGISVALQKARIELQTEHTTLIDLEKAITSVEPTVAAINSVLASFGFNNFKLATTGEHKNLYAIVRGDGTSAASTLSEGEKTFITFLYFYHLIRGSVSESGITKDRVIVFDDPVSSLDSDVLFIVSALIRRIMEEACSGNGRIKQVILLTHNIYFHKEVAFDPKRSTECRAHETFWIVRKVADRSVITGYTINPIKTSYELMWAEVKNPDRSTLTIQNTLRRILENYFKILGNLDFNDIVNKFEGRDQQICWSLFSWVHDGSHSVYDDLYISPDAQAADRYLLVFRQIFEKTNHLSHYAMMMGVHLSSLVPGEQSASVENGLSAAA